MNFPAAKAKASAFAPLEAKLLPPPEREVSVSRSELLDSLEDGAGLAQVVLLLAGPGWGKTTLLAQWASRSSRPFAWVAVGEHDNDPISLLTYVALALDRISVLDRRVFEVLATPFVSIEETVVPSLGAAAGAFDQPFVLALDDVHLLDNAVALDALAAFAGHLPAGAQLVLSARGEPTVASTTLRSRRHQLEIGPNDLRMNEAQASQLLGAAGLDLSERAVTELAEHTEGWPAGLYLAALSIRAHGGEATSAAAFSGSNRLVSDYLQTELLAHLSADERRFLSFTSVVERMSGPLCDAVLEQSGSATTLESIARNNLFLVPLDPEGEWYRYHRLFQELLRSDLERADPEIVPELLTRAAEWCEATGRLDAAIGYAQQAGDVFRVARMVEHRALPKYQRGGAETVDDWLRWLEVHGALERNAAVGVLGGLLAAARGRPAEADRRADAAENAPYEGDLPDGSASIASWLALLRALRCRDGVESMRADAAFALRALAPQSFQRPNARLMLAISEWLAGDTDGADSLFSAVVEDCRALEAPEAVALALSERAAIAIDREEWVHAEELVDRALQVSRRARIEEYPLAALTCAVGARVALHSGDAVRGQALIERAQRLRPGLTYALPHLATQARLALARAYLTTDDPGGARTMLREIRAILRRQPDLGILVSQTQELRSSLTTVHAHAADASSLTEAEMRLIPYLATHLSFRAIGEQLYLSRHTVKSHSVAIYRKLRVTSRSDAVVRANELGLL